MLTSVESVYRFCVNDRECVVLNTRECIGVVLNTRECIGVVLNTRERIGVVLTIESAYILLGTKHVPHAVLITLRV